MHLKEFADYFDTYFHDFLDKKIEECSTIMKEKNSYVSYIKEISQKGKRIRPYNVYHMYMAYGDDTVDIKSFFLAFEIFHTMALMHDDWIDHANTRRGIPTAHKAFEAKIGDAHVAQSQAILLGDLSFAWAYETLAKEMPGIDPAQHKKAQLQFFKMAQEIMLGQMLDVDMMLQEPTTMEAVMTKSYYKTASYTFVRPMLAGAILGGVTMKNELDNVKQLGHYMGVAFQLRDDLLDMYQPHSDKDTFSDVTEGQQTIFTQYVFENGTEDQKAYLKGKMGQTLSEEDKKGLNNLFEDLGSFSYGIEEINNLLDKAHETLNSLHCHDDAKKDFAKLIEKLRVK